MRFSFESGADVATRLERRRTDSGVNCPMASSEPLGYLPRSARVAAITDGCVPRQVPASGQEPEVACARVPIAQVRQHAKQIAVAGTEPAAQCGGELVDRQRRQQATLPDVVDAVVADH